MAASDYYSVLGVGRKASGSEIKKAYRDLAKQFHPDRNPDAKAEQKFKEITEAYEVLSDDQKRATFDQFGAEAMRSAGAGQSGFGGFGSSFADVFDDLFGEFRGRRQNPSGPARGADMRYNLEISLEEAYRGRNSKIKVPTHDQCKECHGTGAAADTKPATCPTCAGLGRVRAQQGFFTIERTCHTCQGAGQIIKNPCKHCSGSGRVRVEKTLSVTIPKGVEDGTRIRLEGEGEASPRGGPAGDLYIFLSVAPHRLFQRDGTNLYFTAHIPMVTAALGGTIEVPDLGGGRAKVKIPPGSQSASKFRLKGKGMPALRGGAAGDLFVQANVETPVNLTTAQQELLHQFDNASEAKKTSPESESFLGKVKEFWDDLKD